MIVNVIQDFENASQRVDTGVSVSRDTTHGCLQEKSVNRRTPNIKKLLKKRHHECLTWTKEEKNKTTAQWSRVLEEEWRGT